MRTVSQAVEEVILRSPFYAEIISEDLGNNAQIARKILPDVEKRLLEEVSLGAIAMALHRLSKNLRAPLFGARMLKSIRGITVRSNLIQIVSPNSPDLAATLDKLSSVASIEKDVFLNFSHGLHESILIVSKELEAAALEGLKNEKQVEKISGLSAITMQLPQECLNVPGVYYPILKAIGQDGISLVEVMSVRTEFSIIFEDKDIERAFSVIKRVTS